jgi:bisanhydrobacterioruberin hydratase
MFKKFSNETMAIAYLAIIYLVGIVGILLPIHPDFILLTPLNLLVSLGVVLWFHPEWSRNTIWVLALCFMGGFAAEVYGVNTGILFGEYSYGPVLGWQLWNTPLMIGVNWMLLAYCCGVTLNTLIPRAGWPLRGLLAAGLMVALDFLIEPVAMHYHFWDWPGDVVPWKNYRGWFLVAWPLLSIFAAWQGQIRNKVALGLLVLQFLFFAILNAAN